jgi:hypothetical protein
MTPSGGNPQTIKRWVEHYGISTAHFNAHPRGCVGRKKPLDEVMVEGSTFSRSHLKKRLYSEGLKARVCEICGQGEDWRGGHMSLILDHINGVADDHRLENLRIVCPNCAATFDTHCGRHNRRKHFPRACRVCSSEFTPRSSGQKFCSRDCWNVNERIYRPRPELRKVARPPLEDLVDDIATMSWLAVGRKHGVSDNAVRKWFRWYEKEAARAA